MIFHNDRTGISEADKATKGAHQCPDVDDDDLDQKADNSDEMIPGTDPQKKRDREHRAKVIARKLGSAVQGGKVVLDVKTNNKSVHVFSDDANFTFRKLPYEIPLDAIKESGQAFGVESVTEGDARLTLKYQDGAVICEDEVWIRNCLGVNFFLSGAGHDEGLGQGTKYIQGFHHAFLINDLCDFRDTNISAGGQLGFIRDVEATVLIYDGPNQFLIVQDYLDKAVKALNVNLPNGSKRNIIGYSFGASYAGGAAIYLNKFKNKKVDKLVLIGAPISNDFLKFIKANVNNVIIVTPPGDFTQPGAPLRELVLRFLTKDAQQQDFPHYYCARDLENDDFQKRRNDLAAQLAKQGLLNCPQEGKK